jgi:hypothetical protein
LVVLIGQRKALALAMKNNRSENRFSGCGATACAGLTPDESLANISSLIIAEF